MPRFRFRQREPLPRIRGTQIGLQQPAAVDQIKADMLAGRFAYEEPQGRIAGIRDHSGTYHVKIGHHRMAAAMEIYWESGDSKPVLELIRCGKWDLGSEAPNDSCPLPARDWWGALRNWLNW